MYKTLEKKRKKKNVQENKLRHQCETQIINITYNFSIQTIHD